MPIIELANAHCVVRITPELGGRIVSLASRSANVELVGPYHLQTWLKSGDAPDPIAGMLHLFQGDLRTRTFEAARSSVNGDQVCELSTPDQDIVFRKRYALAGNRPALALTCRAENRGGRAVRLQFENFFNWSFGPLSDRHDVVTIIGQGDQATRIRSRPYGHASIDSVDGAAGGRLAIADLKNEETLLQLTDTNWLRFAVMDAHGTSWRGPYSQERTVAPGESFTAALELAIVPGVEEAEEHSTKLGCGVNSSTVADHTSSILPGRPGPSRPEASPTARGPDVAAPRDGAGLPLISRVASPDFAVRSLHLIWSQQNAEGLSLDAIKWLLETVVAPGGFNQVVFEFNKALRLQSHPELAEPWSYPAASVADLARFACGLGLDPVPQQNLYGHQTETNLTRVYPELQEVPGDLTVYCPSHPQTHQIVGDIVTELLDLFEPRFFHMGHDEVQFKGMGQRIGVCPRCSSRPPARVFAEDVARISEVATRRNVRSMLWGDLLIPLEFDSGNVNGGDGRVYQAIDLIPRDLVIVDWHYHPGEDYRSTTFFRQQGFSVLSAVSFLPQGIRAFAAHARQAGVDGVMYTTWCRPDPTSLPLESLLYAAQCFQHVESVEDPELDERLQQRAQRLWQQWQRWAAR